MATVDKKIDYVKGQKLLFTLLDKKTLEGIYIRKNKLGSGIIFHNVSFIPFDGKTFEQLEFNLDEILDISPADVEENINISPNEIQSTSHLESQSGSSTGDIDAKKQENCLYEKLKTKVSNLVFIDQIDLKFSEAVSNIQKSRCIALTGEGSDQGRLGNLALLCVASFDSVYLFDVINLGTKIFKASAYLLKKILQSKDVLKVVHNCRLLSDCLKHRYGVTLNNVFDTQACHMIIVKNQSGHPPSYAGFSDLVYEYLKLPRSLCENKVEDPDFWRRRPLLDGMAEAAAWRVLILQTLKPCLDDALYAPFDNLCNLYLRSVRDLDDEYKVRTSVHQNEDLPVELLNDVTMKSPSISQS